MVSRANIPSIDHLYKLSQLYSVHIEDLIRVEDDKQKIYVDIILGDSISLRKRWGIQILVGFPKVF